MLAAPFFVSPDVLHRAGAVPRQNGSPDGRTCAEMEYAVRPIGFVRSPFTEKVEAPRQAVAEGGVDVEGRIEMLPEHEHALEDLEGFDRIWVLFWFHEAKGVRSKVLPPRSDRKRGLFATRSPHRPNPIGMSAVRLVRVEGLVLHVRDLDVIDGTPVIDIKPYVPYADAFPDAKTGWLGAADPRPSWTVRFDPAVEEQLAWLDTVGLVHGLRTRIAEALALGPQPHPYRRIKKTDSGELLLAVKEWRARFTVDRSSSVITVDLIRTGFRPRELATGVEPALAVHRAFVTRFG
jgi:tRNA-Thr(GGU) m(6)t(6)A37 methyltransferase TsaA